MNEAQIAEGFSNPFTEADANADGLLDVEEHIVFHHKLFEYKKANGIPVPDTTKYPREQHVNFFNVLNSINPETDGVSLAEYLSYYRKVADEIDAKRVAFVSLSNAARSEGEEMFAWWQALSEEDKVKFQTYRDSWKQPDFVQQFLAQFQAMFDGVPREAMERKSS